MKITMIPASQYICEEDIKGKQVVIIDVLRATSVITTAVANGAQEVVAVKEIDEALALREEGCVMGGERKALKIEGFDLSNSPLEYTREAIGGRKIIMTTTNGTNAISRATSAKEIIIGCMLNGKAVAKRIASSCDDTVIACAGTKGQFSIDDFICAGKILYDLKELCNIELDDMCSAACMAYEDYKGRVLEYVKNAAHYKYMLSIGLEDDIEYCFKEDETDVVPVYRKGCIIKPQA
jgi:2-phosphosulfolactate phosphatase